ncbi:hypothetical protein JYU14_02390 [Simkania negevensis]|uniref:Uncharacterized protein n=1 Tax=Simkania negevensis TaxID=83561 RepID=A0ABS3AQC1_9BACT|nr:hypothetical protein [Simkania negevensis]
MKKKLCVAIPVGGVVHNDYLEHNLKLLKKTDAYICIGIDEKESLLTPMTGGEYGKTKQLCKEYADQVIEFPEESYYRPGGIWKKLYDCWKASGATYVRGLGYDDFLPPDLVEGHLAFIEHHANLDASYCDYLIQDDTQGSRHFFSTKLSKYKKVKNTGGNPFSFICWLIKFSAINTAEFEHKLLKASAGFEYFLHAVLFTTKCAHFPGSPSLSAVRREHQKTVSQLHQDGVIQEKESIIKEIRALTGYSEEQTMKDWRSLDFPALCRTLRKQQSRPYALIANWRKKNNSQ